MMATSTTTMNPLPSKKPRLNPARRKAAKAKATGQKVQSDSLARKNSLVCSTAQSAKAEKPDSLRASVVQASIPRQKGIQRTAAANAQLGPAKVANPPSNNSKPHPIDDWKGTNIASLDTPAFVTSGLIGCAAGAAILLGSSLWSRMAGVDAAIFAARTSKMVANNLVDESITSMKAGTYNAPEALDMVRRTTLAYAGAIPGGIPFVERLFREIDVVRRNRGGEVDRALVETRRKLASARKRGASASEMHVIVLSQMAKLSAFTSDATQDIMARNPGLRQYLSVIAK